MAQGIHHAPPPPPPPPQAVVTSVIWKTIPSQLPSQRRACSCHRESTAAYILTACTTELKENMADGLVEDKYDAKKMLGKGAYATVWSATKKNSRDYVAIKSINFEDVKKDKLERTLAQVRSCVSIGRSG